MNSTLNFDRYQVILRGYVPQAGAEPLGDAVLLADVGIDSLGTVQLLAALEDEFDVELPDEALTEETFRTVGSLWIALEPLLRNDNGHDMPDDHHDDRP